MSKGFFVKDGTPVYYGTRSDKPQLEADCRWVPSDDGEAPALRDAMSTEPVQAPRITLADVAAELERQFPGAAARMQADADARG